MNMWCAFSRVEPDPDTYVPDTDAIAAMPCYPDNGSVKMMDGVVVVKFAD